MSDADIAWAAGLFEGEGSACRTNRGYGTATLTMNDETVVRRFGAVLGFGNVGGPYTNRQHPTWSSRWTWQTGRREELVRLRDMFAPHLSERRVAQLVVATVDAELPASCEECGTITKGRRRGTRFCTRTCKNRAAERRRSPRNRPRHVAAVEDWQNLP